MTDINFDALFQKQFNALSEKVADIGSIAAGVIGIATLFYFAYKIWGLLARNEQIDLYVLLKPAVIVFLCLTFNSMVVTPIHYVLSPFRTYTAKLVKDSEKDNSGRIDAVIAKAKAKSTLEAKANPNGWMGEMVNGIKDVFENLMLWMLKGILALLSLAKTAIYLIINFLRLFFLVILGMIGPIAFTLSLFPTFENSITNWFAKYLSIYLWAPICNIVNLILNQCELVMTNQVLNGGETPIAMIVMLIVFYIIGFYSFLSVPTIASWIVPGGASSLELSPTLQGAKVAALTGAAATGAAAGKVGSMIKSRFTK